jgi:hypothetical protein
MVIIFRLSATRLNCRPLALERVVNDLERAVEFSKLVVDAAPA